MGLSGIQGPSSWRRGRLAAAFDPGVLADEELLDQARRGDSTALGELYDRHGGALFKLAHAVAGDDTEAGAAVVQALAAVCDATCGDPGSTDPSVSVLHELSRRTFLAASAPAAAPVGSGEQDPVEDIVHAVDTSLVARDPRQRALLGLTRCGDHTYREAAALLGMSPDVAAQELRTALRASTGAHSGARPVPSSGRQEEA